LLKYIKRDALTGFSKEGGSTEKEKRTITKYLNEGLIKVRGIEQVLISSVKRNPLLNKVIKMEELLQALIYLVQVDLLR
jgi:hypothetical protein